MFNELLLSATLNMSLVQVPYVQQYPVSNAYNSIINTSELSKKNAIGAYPWEIVKLCGNNIYFLYQNYFRIGGKSAVRDSNAYRYFQGLNYGRRNIICKLINPTDYRWIRYFNIDSVLTALFDKGEKIKQTNKKSLSKLLYYRQIVLDLQKEVLDFKQTVWEMTREPVVNL